MLWMLKKAFRERVYIFGSFVSGIVLVASGSAQNGVPRPDHVVMVIEENKAFERIIGSEAAPYINSLAQRGALFTSSFAIRHPSEPNYLALFSGSTHGVGDDSCPHTFSTANLGSELFDAGFTFAGYSESMPHAGYKGCETGNYARKHNPWVNFTNIPASANLPFANFPTNFSELPTVSIVAPNLNNDMHDGPIPLGDSWLHDHFEPYLQWAMANNSLFILTWDEGHNGTDNRIVTIFVGPMVRPGEYCERINHYNTLRTLQEMYGLAPIDNSATVDPVTSVWTPESVSSPLSVALTSPAPDSVLGAPATVTLTAEAASSGSEVTGVEFYQRGTKLGEATNSPFTFTWNNVPAGSYCLLAKARDASGRRKTSLSISVEVRETDRTLPSVTVMAPADNARVTNGLITLQGTAGDNVGVQRVEYQVGAGPVQVAVGTTNWSAQVELPPGPSTIQVWSVDISTNRSVAVTRSVTFAVLSRLTVEIGGPGKMVPELNGQNLEVGRTYEIKPVPESGVVFAASGVSASSLAPFRFIMESNLVLRLSFVPNPFPQVIGVYEGLIYDTNQVGPQSSGFFNLTLDAKGAFTARVQLGQLSVRVGGGFDAFGRSSSLLTRPNTDGRTLSADWELDLTNGTDQIHGVVHQLGNSNDVLFAEIFGDREVFTGPGATNLMPREGQYTIIFPHDSSDLTGPEGDGFGAVTIDNKGRIRLAGMLADGNKLTQRAALSRAGQWPLYVPVDGGAGAFLGWVEFTNPTTSELTGLVNWITPSRPTAKIYPGGFTNEVQSFGSLYHAPPVLSITNALLIFEGADLPAAFTNHVRLDANGTVSNQSSNRLTLSFTRQTGLWRGTVVDPVTLESLHFLGAVDQGQNSGHGFFLRTNQSGRVRLLPTGG